MKRLDMDNQMKKALLSEQDYMQAYKGCGVINCRSRLKGGAPVRDEIQAIIDARTSGRGIFRK